MTSPSAGAPRRESALTAAMCLACACSVAPFGSYPALLPRFFEAQRVTTREATFVNAAFFAGYMLLAPVATTLTDRIDARRLVLPALSLGALSALAFAAAHGHFWVALAARAANGACVAVSFMPGLRALTDRLPTERSTRFVGFYMSSFALGTSLSYVASDALATRIGLDLTLYAMALGPMLARLIVMPWLAPVAIIVREQLPFHAQLLPVLRHPALLSLVFSYGLHCAELFVLRSWCVAFLASVDESYAFVPPFWLSPAVAVAVANVLTAPASVLGNELSMRVGARRYIAATLTLSPIFLGSLGFVHALGPVPSVLFVLLCAIVLGADSAAITSRLIAAAPVAQRGVTMALHTAIGFLGAFIGPLLLGLVLDAAGGPREPAAWRASFAVVGAASLLGSVLVLRRSTDPHAPG